MNNVPKLFQKRGHYSRGVISIKKSVHYSREDIIQGNTVVYEILYMEELKVSKMPAFFMDDKLSTNAVYCKHDSDFLCSLSNRIKLLFSNKDKGKVKRVQCNKRPVGNVLPRGDCVWNLKPWVLGFANLPLSKSLSD